MKKWIAIFMALISVLTLMVACKGEEPATTGTGNTETATIENSAQPPTQEPTQAPAEDDGLVSVWIAKTKEYNGRLFEVNYAEDYTVLDEVYQKDGEERRRYSYECDAQGRITKVVGTGEIEVNQNYGYDTQGRLVSFEDCDTDWNVKASHTYTYDDQGRILEHTNFKHRDDSKKVDWRRVYHYDAAGNLEEMLEYGSQDDSKLERYCTYTYNAEGKCVSCRQILDDSTYSTEHTYTYNHRGNLSSEEITYISGEIAGKTVTWSVIVDENGNTTQLYGDEYDTMRKYTYEEIRVTPELAEKIRKNQADLLSTDLAMSSDEEIKKPI